MRTSHAPWLYSLSQQVYGQLIRLYPSSYRRKYALDMQRTFEDCCHFACQQAGNWGLLRLWMPTLTDLSLTVIEKHLDEGVLSSGTTMIRGASFALLAIAALLYATAWDVGVPQMLIATLLLIIGALGVFLTSANTRDILRRRFDKRYASLERSSTHDRPEKSGRNEMFKFERDFLRQWVAVSGLGLALGFTIYIVLTVNVAENFALGLQSLIAAGGGLLLGAAIGIAQWLVLRRRLPQPNRWIVSSMVAGAGGGILELLIRYQLTGDDVGYYRMAIGSAVIGCALGIAGWLVLRRYVARAGWWVLASALGLVVAIALSSMLGRVLYDLTPESADNAMSRTLAMVLFGLLLLTAYGGITGLALIWLFKQPRESQANLSHGAA